MSLFDRAKFILTANAYKAGKLYSLKGNDVLFSRPSIATRVDSSGNVESTAINVPRLNYVNNTAKIQIEASATNLQTKQDIVALPGGTVSLNSRTSPKGDTTAHSLIFGGSLNEGALIPITGAVASPSTQYTFSFWARSVSGNGNINIRISTDTNSSLYSGTIVATTVWARYTHTFTTDAGDTLFISGSRFRNNNNNFGEVEIWGMQLELGAVATSYMLPGSLTRAADQPESFNPISLGYLLANEGSIVINDTVYKYTTDGNLETFVDGVSQGTEAATPPTSWTLPLGETERVLMFDYPLSTNEIEAL